MILFVAQVTLPQFPRASQRRSFPKPNKGPDRGLIVPSSIKQKGTKAGKTPTKVLDHNDFIGLELDKKFQAVLGKTADPVLAKNLANLDIPSRSFLLSNKREVWGKKGGGVPPNFSLMREESKSRLGNVPWAEALTYTRMCRLGDEADKIIPRDRTYCPGDLLRSEEYCRSWCRGLIAFCNPAITNRYRKFFGKTSLTSFHLLDSVPLRVLRVIVSSCIRGASKFINFFKIPKRGERLDPLLFLTARSISQHKTQLHKEYRDQRGAELISSLSHKSIRTALALIPHIAQGLVGLDRLMLD